jgi:hypothetical protein
MVLMKYLPRFLNRWLAGRNKPPWTRETQWRQGSVLAPGHVEKLKLVGRSHLLQKLVVVVSHDCDLAGDIEDEPKVEVIVASRIDKCLPDRTHAKNIRALHIEMTGSDGIFALELLAANKVSIPKMEMAGYSPAIDFSIGKAELDTLRIWLAARYKRATIPDGLQDLIKDIFADVAKKRDRPRALRGIWIDFDPDLDKLEENEKYELWIVIVYSTFEQGAERIAEETASQIGDKFRRKYLRDGNWVGLELRQCEVRPDTGFSLHDASVYKLFRLEYLSIRAGTVAETGNE